MATHINCIKTEVRGSRICIQAIALVGMLMFLSSCVTDSEPPVIDKERVYGIDVDATTSVLLIGRRIDSLDGETVDGPIVSAILADRSGPGVDGGEVIVGGDSLDKETQSGYTTYGHWRSTTRLITPNFISGGKIYFHVTGSSMFLPLTLNVSTPNGLTIITRPILLDTIDRSEQYTVTWNFKGPADTAIISVIPENDTTGTFITIETADDGSYALSSTDLSRLPVGRALLRVARRNWNNDTSGGRKVFGYVVSEQGKEVILK